MISIISILIQFLLLNDLLESHLRYSISDQIVSSIKIKLLTIESGPGSFNFVGLHWQIGQLWKCGILKLVPKRVFFSSL